jgi:hypothetical protein
VLNFVEQKTNNHNLWNINLNQSLIQTFALVQYYLTQPSIVSIYGASPVLMFEQQTNTLQANTYVDEGKNYTQNISYFLRDYLDVKLYVITGTLDYVTYYKATRNWMETELNFVESPNFQKLNLTVIFIATQDITINGTVQARTKAVKQVAYSEVINSGHYLFGDKSYVVNYLVKQWVSGKTEALTATNLLKEELVI